MKLASILLLALGVVTVPLTASGQQFPTKPMRIVVPYAAGGGTDVYARLIATKLNEAWGQPVVVDNRPGGGTIIGAAMVAKSAADGHTLLLIANPLTTNAALKKDLPYDTLRDFAPITMIASAPVIFVVHPSLPVRSIKELIALARTHPDKISYASSGNGGPQHLAGELFNTMAGVRIVHVPYKGSAPATTDLLGGQVQMGISSIAVVRSFVKAGRLRPLAVTSIQRSTMMPDVPTVHESGLPGYRATTWYGMFAPAGIPPAVLAALNTEVTRAIKSPEISNRILNDAAEVVANDSAAFTEFLRAEVDSVRKLSQTTKLVIN